MYSEKEYKELIELTKQAYSKYEKNRENSDNVELICQKMDLFYISTKLKEKNFDYKIFKNTLNGIIKN